MPEQNSSDSTQQFPRHNHRGELVPREIPVPIRLIPILVPLIDFFLNQKQGSTPTLTDLNPALKKASEAQIHTLVKS